MNDSVWEILGISKGNLSRRRNVEEGSEGNLVGEEMLKKGAKGTEVKCTEVKVFVCSYV